MAKYGHLSHNYIEAILNKMGGEDAAQKFLNGELEILPKKQPKKRMSHREPVADKDRLAYVFQVIEEIMESECSGTAEKLGAIKRALDTFDQKNLTFILSRIYDGMAPSGFNWNPDNGYAP